MHRGLRGTRRGLARRGRRDRAPSEGLRLLAEQAEAWRAREITPREALDALVHGFHFTAGTLLHTQRAVGGARLPGVMQALFTLMEEGPAELLEHAIECITERAQPLLRTPLLLCPSDELVDGYADLVHQLVQCAATARASTDALLTFLSALLGLLPEAVSLIRRGGVAADAAHTYVLLLRRLASCRWGRAALETAASVYELRLLRLHVDEMEEAEESATMRMLPVCLKERVGERERRKIE